MTLRERLDDLWEEARVRWLLADALTKQAIMATGLALLAFSLDIARMRLAARGR